jgi:hypothetical protein
MARSDLPLVFLRRDLTTPSGLSQDSTNKQPIIFLFIKLKEVSTVNLRGSVKRIKSEQIKHFPLNQQSLDFLPMFHTYSIFYSMIYEMRFPSLIYILYSLVTIDITE